MIARVGGLRLVDVVPSTLTTMYAEMRADGGRRDGKPGGLSPRTVRYIHTIVRRALADAVVDGLLVRNPADAAKLAGREQARAPEHRTWTGEQLGGFLGLVDGDRYRPAWFFLATTGTRRGECLGLRWRDLNLDAARATIRQTVTAVEHRIVVASRTKTGRGGAIDLDADTAAELRSHRARQAREMLALGIAVDDDTLVFCHPDGRPYHPERFSREFDRRLDRPAFADLPRIRLHDLRHTWATLALAAGVPLKVVSERLGHAKTGITSDLYQHVTPTMQADAAEKVANLIFVRDAR